MAPRHPQQHRRRGPRYKYRRSHHFPQPGCRDPYRLGSIQAFGDHQTRTRQMLALEDTLQREGKTRFAVTFKLLFLEAWYYSKHPEQYESITSHPRDGVTKYIPLHFVSVEEIVANARQTAVIDPGPALAEALERAGLHLKVRFADPLYVVYLE